MYIRMCGIIVLDPSDQLCFCFIQGSLRNSFLSLEVIDKFDHSRCSKYC